MSDENVTSEVIQEVAAESTAENSAGDHEAAKANVLDFDDLLVNHFFMFNSQAPYLLFHLKYS